MVLLELALAWVLLVLGLVGLCGAMLMIVGVTTFKLDDGGTKCQPNNEKSNESKS